MSDSDQMREDEVGAQAVYSLLGLLHSAQEISKLLPREPSVFRQKVMEALTISEIALLRFKMELFVANHAEFGDLEEVH